MENHTRTNTAQVFGTFKPKCPTQTEYPTREGGTREVEMERPRTGQFPGERGRRGALQGPLETRAQWTAGWTEGTEFTEILWALETFHRTI